MSRLIQAAHRGTAVCIGGVPGAGKTTLLRSHVERERRDMQITGSSIVKQIIAPSTVQELDGWPSSRREAVREQSIRELVRLREACAGRMLVDGHFTLRNRVTGELEAIFTAQDKAFFQALILIHPTAEKVLEQRQGDSRPRADQSLTDIAAHIEFEWEEGRRLAVEMGVPLLELSAPGLSQRLQAVDDFLRQVAPLDLP